MIELSGRNTEADMKRPICILILLAMISCLLFCACGGNGSDNKARFASDEDVIAEWDKYPMLDTVPRFTLSGVLDDFYINEERTVVSFLGVSQESYEAYVQQLMNEGFRLKENSSVWVTEGMTGVPEFTRNGQELILVWSANGTLDISAEALG